MTRYQPSLLFTLAAYHAYFADGLCTVLSFHPGESTKALQKRFGFPLIDTKNGFMFYMTSDKDATQFLSYVRDTTGNTFFDFIIQTSTENFYNYTELPPVWKGLLEYDSGNTAVPVNDVFLLKQQLSPATDTYETGRVRIHFDDIISQQKKGMTPVYEIQFEARTSQWQYYFINDSGIPFGDPAIITNDEFVFNGPEKVTIPNGAQAQLFSSGTRSLTLSERPAYRFSLVNRNVQNPGRDKMIIKRLPCADPETFTLTKAGNELQYTSPIYVFI